eukprot:gene44989-55999_t
MKKHQQEALLAEEARMMAGRLKHVESPSHDFEHLTAEEAAARDSERRYALRKQQGRESPPRPTLPQKQETWSDGHVYLGEFKDGRQHGEGKLTWANGDVYSGTFFEDKHQGFGTYTWANGYAYS